MRYIDRAIALAPDVSRYHVNRGNILDQTKGGTTTLPDQARLALEAYLANRSAVLANPFDIYGRLHFAESTLRLTALGEPGKGEEAIQEYRQLTLLQPRFWLSHLHVSPAQ